MNLAVRLLVPLFLATTATLPASGQQGQPQSRARNEPARSRHTLALRTHFFRHATGKFDTENAPDVGGWNVFISSEIVLVLTTIAGPAFQTSDNASLALVARGGGQILGQKWFSLRQAYFSETGHVTIPYLVFGVGVCSPIEVTAVLQVRGRRQKVRQEIPMACGE
jgi:hypothetical protein